MNKKNLVLIIAAVACILTTILTIIIVKNLPQEEIEEYRPTAKTETKLDETPEPDPEPEPTPEPEPKPRNKPQISLEDLTDRDMLGTFSYDDTSNESRTISLRMNHVCEDTDRSYSPHSCLWEKNGNEIIFYFKGIGGEMKQTVAECARYKNEKYPNNDDFEIYLYAPEDAEFTAEHNNAVCTVALTLQSHFTIVDQNTLRSGSDILIRD